MQNANANHTEINSGKSGWRRSALLLLIWLIKLATD